MTLKDVKADYRIYSNREAGGGRYDIALIPKAASGGLGIVFEIKSCADVDKVRLQTAAEGALAQIIEQRYADVFAQQPVEHLLKIGLAFCGKTLALAYEKTG